MQIKKLSLSFFLVLVFCNTVYALPICEGEGYKQWTNCFAIYTNKDGDKYIGAWKNGKKYGHGTETFENRSKYVGEWKDDKRHGQGTFTDKDGNVSKGIWKDDKLVEAQSSSSSSVSSNKDQAKRKALIDKMINTYHIVEKIEIPGSLPRVWVTPQFHRLTFSDKKTFIHLIYSYYYTKNPKYDMVRIFDNMTGKEIGGYMPPFGLDLK
jgi:hypothetical protein